MYSKTAFTSASALGATEVVCTHGMRFYLKPVAARGIDVPVQVASK
jgi:hypothetical protein